MEPELELLRPRPLHLYRPAGTLGQSRRLELHGADGLAAKGAADAGRPNVDLAVANAQFPGDHVAHVKDVLRADPKRERVPAGGLRDRSAGLDRRMRRQRDVETQIDVPAGLSVDVARRDGVAETAIGEPPVDVDCAIDVRLAEGPVGRPFDVERRRDAVERTGRRRENAQPATLAEGQRRVVDDTDEARNPTRRRDVPRGRPRRQLRGCRRAQDAAMNQSVDRHVGGIERLAAHDGVGLLERDALADKAGLAGKGAELGDGSRLDLEVAIGPAGGERVAQGGAGLGEGNGERLDRLAAHRGSHALHVDRPLQCKADVVPPDTELLAGDLLERRRYVLAEFDARQVEVVSAVFVADPTAGRVGRRFGSLRDDRQRRAGGETDRDRPGAEAERDECPAPHLIAPEAARRIALRTRRYVPQRQRLSAIAASIWDSLGFGVRSSRATADMICPAWQ